MTGFLSVNVAEQPHCLALCQSCAELYAVGQPFFLRTPEAQVTTARELMKKLLDQDKEKPTPTDLPEPQPEPATSLADGAEEEGGSEALVLRPIEFDAVEANARTQVISTTIGFLGSLLTDRL